MKLLPAALNMWCKYHSEERRRRFDLVAAGDLEPVARGPCELRLILR